MQRRPRRTRTRSLVALHLRSAHSNGRGLRSLRRTSSASNPRGLASADRHGAATFDGRPPATSFGCGSAGARYSRQREVSPLVPQSLQSAWQRPSRTALLVAPSRQESVIVPRAGFEPAASALGERRSFQLSYRGQRPELSLTGLGMGWAEVGLKVSPYVLSCPLVSPRKWLSRANLA